MIRTLTVNHPGQTGNIVDQAVLEAARCGSCSKDRSGTERCSTAKAAGLGKLFSSGNYDKRLGIAD